MKFTELTISNPNGLIFGVAPKPVLTKRGILIGGGLVYPELNFTLPPVEVSKSNLAEVRTHYSDIVTGALTRAMELNSPGLILEFETVVEMTLNPDIGVEIVGRCPDDVRYQAVHFYASHSGCQGHANVMVENCGTGQQTG